MKKQIIIFFILIVSLNLSAQTDYYPIDFTGYRLLNLTNSIYDNGFLMAGTKANQYDNESHGYGILKKLDINGNPLWEKLIGIVPPPAWTNIRYVSQTNDGGYIISGAVNRVGTDFGFDMFVIKTNYCGELQWQKIFSSVSTQNVHEIYELGDGSFLVQLDLWESENDPNKRLWVFKLDQNGNTLWKKYFADYDPWPGSSEMVWQFLPDKIGNYAMTGYYYHRNPEGDSTVVWLRPFVLKIDTAGNEIWHNILGVQDYFYGANFSACANSLGSIYSAGQKRLPSEAFINKVDYTGQTIYKNVLPLNALRSSAIGITSLNDSTFYTVVYTVDSIDQVNDVASYHLLQLDSNAVIMDSVMMLDSTVLNSSPMLITKDSKILIGSYELNFGPDNWTGKLWKYNTNLEIDSVYTQNFLYDTLCPYPITNDTIALDTTTVINLEHLWNELKPMSIFPNPVKNKLNIIINIVKWQQRQLVIRDINGREILNEYIAPGKANHQLDVSAFENGIYMVSLLEKGKLLQTEKVVVSH